MKQYLLAFAPISSSCDVSILRYMIRLAIYRINVLAVMPLCCYCLRFTVCSAATYLLTKADFQQ